MPSLPAVRPEFHSFPLMFDLSFDTEYQFSQVRQLFKQTAMRDVFTKTEIDDIVEDAYFQQDGQSYIQFRVLVR